MLRILEKLPNLFNRYFLGSYLKLTGRAVKHAA